MTVTGQGALVRKIAVMAAAFLALGPGTLTAQAATIQTRVAEYLRAYADAGLFSGIVTIGRGDTILARVSVGSIDTRGGPRATELTHFRIASISKTLTAGLIVKLAQGGRLRYGDPLARFLPGFPNGDHITIDQLLRHTSGVGEFSTPDVWLESLPLDSLVSLIAAVPTEFAPGTGDQYSNEGYVLLAKVIELASGMTYQQYLTQALLRPLRLQRTVIAEARLAPGDAVGHKAQLRSPPVPITRMEAPLLGASGLASTASDLMRWLEAVRSKTFIDYDSLPYPYGWGRRIYASQQLIEQSGSVEGYGAYIASYKDGTWVVCLSNVQSGMQGRWGPDFAAILYGGEPSAPPMIVPSIPGVVKRDVAGEYKSPAIGNPLILQWRGRELWMTWGTFPFWQPLTQLGRDRFLAVEDYSVITAVRDRAGIVTGVRMGALASADTTDVRFVKRRAH